MFLLLIPWLFHYFGRKSLCHLQHMALKAALNIQIQSANMWQVFVGRVWSDKQHLLQCSTGHLHSQSSLQQERWEKSSCELRRKKEMDLVNSHPDSTTLLSPVFCLAPSLVFTFWPLHFDPWDNSAKFCYLKQLLIDWTWMIHFNSWTHLHQAPQAT